MRDSLLNISIDESFLTAVPAVHFHHSFAEHVNQICWGSWRPDAIAVELGPESALAAEGWIRSLGNNRGKEKNPFPCMLGICKPDRKNPTPCNPHALTGGRSGEPRGAFSGHNITHSPLVSMLPLTPTDSIIEAIRCAVELNIPLYGIDIENIEDPNHSGVMLQDTVMAKENLDHYVALHLPFAGHGRDDDIDDKREEVMAARLKGILKRHRRVLFTGGMGHWQRIRSLLTDSSIRADFHLEADTNALADFRPVIVHPLLAYGFIDKFPLIAEVYERQRIPAFPGVHRDRKRIQPALLFNTLFEKTCQRFFGGSHEAEAGQYRHIDLHNVPALKQYLIHLCMIKQLATPDLNTAIQAAESMMSKEFCTDFFARLMEIPWASPASFPDLPIIKVSEVTDGNAFTAEYIDKAGSRSTSFALNIFPEGPLPELKMNMPLNWSGEIQRLTRDSGSGYLRTWPAWDHLLTGLCLHAQQKAILRERQKVSISFEGSIGDGLDVKSTIRACIRGESTIYVKDLRPRPRSKKTGIFDLVPAVYIFHSGRSRTSKWVIHQVCLNHMYPEHIKNPDLFHQTIREKGEWAVSAVNFGEKSCVSGPIGRTERVTLSLIRGIIVFIPVYFNGIQEAKWLEDTQYLTNPIYQGGEFEQLKSNYLDKHGIDLSMTNWGETLIRMAIPFAKKNLMVIAPDDYNPTKLARDEAKRHGTGIQLVPHSAFPEAQIFRAAYQHCVEPLDKEGLFFPEWADGIVQTRVDAFKNMMPKKFLNYGMEYYQN